MRILLCLLALGFLGVGTAKAAEGQAVPSIKYAGILPPHLQGELGRTIESKSGEIEASFRKAARESRRFSYVSDEIVNELWGNAEGRRRLREDYEVDAYLNLNLAKQGDVALLTARLLGPELENYLSETERVPEAWFQTASPLELDNRIKALTYRVLNRYPVDVFVTSLQGRYITLSAGKDQGVQEGDQLDFVSVSIKSLHPVDGTWLDFDQKPLGSAKVIESKNQSAIALIGSMTSEGAIRIGSAARVATIATRNNFKDQAPKEPELIVQPSSPLVNPQAPKAHAPKPTPPPAPTPAAQPTKPESNEPEHPALPSHPALSGAMPVQSSDEGEGSAGPGVPLQFEDVRLSIEHENFSYSGSAKASSSFPPLLVNRIGGQVAQKIDEEALLYLNGHLRLGETSKGSYQGLGLAAEYLYIIPMTTGTIPSLDRVLVGAQLDVMTLGVNKESFGGIDRAGLAPSAHMQGSYHIADLVETIEYDLIARVNPFAFGNAGIKGKTRSVASGMGLQLEGQFLQKNRSAEYEWGGLVAFEQGGWDLSKGTLNNNGFRLGLLVRLRI